MDRLEAMGLFLSVAELGSFSATSRKTGIPLATVSRKIAELEAHLATKLLLRTTRRLTLTEAGETYRKAARRIVEQVDEAERMAAGEYAVPRGELVLTAPLLFGRLFILPLVTEFLRAYPDIDVRLLLSDRNLHLLEDHVDMAARIGPLPDSGLIATRIGSMRRVVCASPSCLAAHGRPERPDELERFPIVGFEYLAPVVTWRFFDAPARKAIECPGRPRLSVSTAEAAVAAAVEGVGATWVLHYQCSDAVRSGLLEIVLSHFELTPLPVHLLHAGQGYMPLKTRVFLDFAAPRLRARLAELERSG